MGFKSGLEKDFVMSKDTESGEALKEHTEKLYGNMANILGEYIAFVRNKKGISLRDLRTATDISIAVISDLENGKKIPRFEILIKILLALGIPINVIFSNKFSENKRVAKMEEARDGELLINTLLNEGMTRQETAEILKFIDYTKYKRNK